VKRTLSRHLRLWTNLHASRFCLAPALVAVLTVLTVLTVLSLGTLGVETASAFTADSCNGRSAYSVVGDVATCTYAATGEYAFKVPADVGSLDVRAVGGKGGASLNGESAGGFGAEVSSELEVNPGSELRVRVAGNGELTQGGYNGGGSAAAYPGGGGGGASTIVDPANNEEELLVAGGGGGGGGQHNAPGGAAEVSGSRAPGNAGNGFGGGAGTERGRGAGGWGGFEQVIYNNESQIGPNGKPYEFGNAGLSGERGHGGNGSYGYTGQGGAGGGGGGGGYWGGGAGGSGGGGYYTPIDEGGGGGGGSSTIGNSENGSITTNSTGSPLVSISWTVAPPTATITSPAPGATYTLGQAVDEEFSCAEGPGGSGLASCLDESANPSGIALETLVPGPHTLTVTATSEDGQTGTEEVEYTVVAAPTATITSPANGATYAVGQAVPEEFNCTEGAYGPGLSSCLDQNGNPTGTALETLVPGTHTLTVIAISSDGQSGTASVEYTVAAPPTATVTTPESGATYAVGETVPEEFSCTDGTGGPGIATCLDQNGSPSGTDLETSTPGTHTLTVTATSSDGQTGEAAISYTVAVAPPRSTTTITSPTEGAVYTVGQIVPEEFSCAVPRPVAIVKPANPGPISCLDQNGNPSGTDLDTSTPGEYTLTVTSGVRPGAISRDGVGNLSASASVTYTVAAAPATTITTPASVPTPTPVLPAAPAPLPPAATPPAPTTPTPTPPAVSDLQVLHSCLKDAALDTPHPGRKGLAVSFDLSEAATVSYTVERREGSVVQRYCSALRPRHPRPGGQPGQYEEVGSGRQPGASAGGHTTKIGNATAAAAATHKQLTGHSPAGQRHISLTALGRHLAPGTYIVSVSATNAAGETSNKALAYIWVLGIPRTNAPEYPDA
jgi:hypothetical protein